METITAASDEAIVAGLIRDLDVGFTDLVRTHQRGIYSGALRLTRSHVEAEDVAQETFVRAYRSLSAWGDTRLATLSVRPWLWTIALNLVRTRSGRPTEHPTPDGWAHPPATDSEPIDAELWRNRLGRLSENQRTAVVLRHVLDLPIAEIAEVTERPEGTVKADISRGLAQLRQIIEWEVA